jgi:hypothetical protein
MLTKKMLRVIVVLTCAVASGVHAGLILNGGFEDGTWGAFLAPASWNVNGYDYATEATVTTGVHTGSQCLAFDNPSTEGTTPMVSQSFVVGAGVTGLTVTYWVRNIKNGNDLTNAQGFVRIREDTGRTAAAGAAYYWTYGNGAGDTYNPAPTAIGKWVKNPSAWNFDSAVDFTSGNTAATGARSAWNLYNGEWTQYTLNVTSLPVGVTNYAIDLMSSLYTSYGEVTYFDDVSVTAIPEPAMLGLLAVGGALLLRRRAGRSAAI